MSLSPQQGDLLAALIEADRDYRTRVHYGKLDVLNVRGVEIGMLGHSRRTAESLERMGLIELIGEGRLTYAYLGKYQPYDPPQENA